MTHRFCALVALCLAVQARAAEYTIHNRLEVLKPVDVGAMNTDFQSATIVSDTGPTLIVDIDYYPLRSFPALHANPNWKTDDAGMAEYLQPGLTADWDETFRETLLQDLAAAKIIPSQLSDVDLVRAVSPWMLAHFSESAPFVAYSIDFVNGRPAVNPATRVNFDSEKAKFSLATDEEAFERGLFGTGLYAAKIHGSCTPTAILQNTIYRALGLPTRIVTSVPAVDANDSSQVQSILDGIHHIATREVVHYGIKSLVGSFAAHTFNEVYLGGRWVRLNYDNLDQPTVDGYYMGLLTQVKRVNDWSEAGLVDTWGARTANPGPYSPALSSLNPYRSLGLSDNLDALPELPNPSIQGTVSQVWLEGDPAMPGWLQAAGHDDGFRRLYVAVAEPLVFGAYSRLDMFGEASTSDIQLVSSGHPTVATTVFAGSFSNGVSDPHGIVFFIPEDQADALVSGAAYSLNPLQTTARLKWVVPVGFTFRAP